MTSAIRVGVVDDHEMILSGFAREIESTSDLLLVGAAPSVHELDSLMAGADLDVVVLDLRLPTEPSGPEAVRHFDERGARVIVVSSVDDGPSVIAMIKAGAIGYITKSSRNHEIISAIRNAAEGVFSITPVLAHFLIANDQRDRPRLTNRELEVLECAARGDRDAEIAADLNISLRTVQNHLSNIRDKVGVNNRTKLARWAINNIAQNRLRE